jgi:alpha-ketoglutarate-dependent taurine dioxygenase
MPEKSIKIIEATSVEDLFSDVDALKAVFKRDGVLVIRGGDFSLEDQVELTKTLGDSMGWNVSSDAHRSTIETSIYPGGHSDNVDKDYNQTSEEYVLDWHIEQVYYVYPILAGVWHMTTFTAPAGSGTTRFVDSAELYALYSNNDREFLSKSIVKWDKPTPHGTGPFYTKVVDKHPLTQQEILRVETDRGSYLMPELALWDGKPPTEEQVSRLNVLLDVLKTNLNDNLEIRYSQLWEEGDILIVDLFRMYHSVMGGFTAGQRKFTGIGIRPKIYDNSMYTTMELWTDK